MFGLAFLKNLIPWQAWAVLGALIAAALLFWYINNAAYQRGVTAERTRIEEANTESRRLADEASRNLQNCPADKWNRETGRCDR